MPAPRSAKSRLQRPTRYLICGAVGTSTLQAPSPGPVPSCWPWCCRDYRPSSMQVYRSPLFSGGFRDECIYWEHTFIDMSNPSVGCGILHMGLSWTAVAATRARLLRSGNAWRSGEKQHQTHHRQTTGLQLLHEKIQN